MHPCSLLDFKSDCANPGHWISSIGYPGESILEEAARLVNGPKAKDYGPPKLNFQRLADLMTAYISNRTDPSAPFEPWEIADLFILHKLARNQQSRVRDTYVDIIGYAICGAKCAGIEE